MNCTSWAADRPSPTTSKSLRHEGARWTAAVQQTDMHGAPYVEARGLQGNDWGWICDFWFVAGLTEIRLDDQPKLSALVAALRREPTRRVALDGTVRERDGAPDNPRVSGLQRSLIGAGIDAGCIVVGEIGRGGLRHAQRVEVLIGPP